MFQSLSAWFPPDTDEGHKALWRQHGGKSDSAMYAYFLFIKDPFVKRSFELITSESNEGISFIRVEWIDKCLEEGDMISTADFVIDKPYVTNNKQLYLDKLSEDKDKYSTFHELDNEDDEGFYGAYNFKSSYTSINDNDNYTSVHHLDDKFDVESLYKTKSIALLSEYRDSLPTNFDAYHNFNYNLFKVEPKYNSAFKSKSSSLSRNSDYIGSTSSNINNNNNNSNKSSTSNSNSKDIKEPFDDDFLDEPSLSSFSKNTSYNLSPHSKDTSYSNLKLSSPQAKKSQSTVTSTAIDTSPNKDVINLD
ncbi:hypothetical protein CYY_003296 [Polysphondylium violaceum]|uniref:BRCT domain-containing protein n=1 Tax=Polysphondylium violaceum TaxID=133409 RepID=A0A8J4PZU1_9MYCE|nr:hypothetical protein CYY_003296 [Polysphondylium violaceum]